MVAGLAMRFGSAGEVLPTAGFERGARAAGCGKCHKRMPWAAAGEAADACDGYSGDGCRHSYCCRRGEEQLVVLAAVQCRFEGGVGAELQGQWMNREDGLLDFGADVGGSAEMGEVGREAVADVDAGRGQIAPQEGFAGIEARLGE